MENLIGIKEACEILNLSRSSMKRYVANGAIRSIRIGRCRRFAPEDLREWVDQQKEAEPPLVFKYQWVTKMRKWVEKMDEMFGDPEIIRNLTFNERLRLSEHLNENLKRGTTFLLKLRASGITEQLKQKGEVEEGYGC